ncbi:hypothetical protein L3V86_05300 [Thiotrichales bacterium 19S11-10]|nr:hypothetical protein [Thiotrichales bacterium 19S11-10]
MKLLKALIFIFLLIPVNTALATDKEKNYIALTYLDLLARKIWDYSEHNTDTLVKMAKEDINVYTQLFAPKLFTQYKDGKIKDLHDYLREILIEFISHLRNYNNADYYVQKTVQLGLFNTSDLSYHIKPTQLIYITYPGYLPLSINGHSFKTSYTVSLKAIYKLSFEYTEAESEKIEHDNITKEACLTIYIKPNSLKQQLTNSGKNFSQYNFEATADNFKLDPYQACKS